MRVALSLLAPLLGSLPENPESLVTSQHHWPGCEYVALHPLLRRANLSQMHWFTLSLDPPFYPYRHVLM
jgi:hypothetical protein